MISYCTQCRFNDASAEPYRDGLCGPCRRTYAELPVPRITQTWNRGNGPKYHRIARLVDQYHAVARCGYRMDVWWLPDSFSPDPASTCQKCACWPDNNKAEITQPK